MLVKDLMSKEVRACYLDDSLEQAVRKMKEYDVGFVPVVDLQNKLTNVITDRDVVLQSGKLDKPLSQIKCQELTDHREIYSCYANDDIKEALTIMRTKKVHRLPVIDDEERVTGVLGLADIIKNTSLNDWSKISPKETLSTLQGIFTD